MYKSFSYDILGILLKSMYKFQITTLGLLPITISKLNTWLNLQYVAVINAFVFSALLSKQNCHAVHAFTKLQVLRKCPKHEDRRRVT